MIDIDFLAWANMGVRWLHFIAGIAWIGASFYFVWLDNSLRANDRLAPGVAGDLWAVHGGGFYHNEKFLVAPPQLPKELHWFKWEAYTTWLSGFALLIIIYYVGAETYLIDRSKLDIGQGAAILIGLAALAGGWIMYDLLCKSPLARNQALLSGAWFALLIAATAFLTRVFTDKGAFMHVGAIIGTVMVANVFFVIIPNQKKTVAAMIAGEAPDAALGAAAKQRSVHNNYMTLPVLLIMISGHYPLLVSHQYNWLLLAGFSVAAVMIRHFFNLKHKGAMQPALAAGAATVFLATILAASVKPTAAIAVAPDEKVEDSVISVMMNRHCVSCHAAEPVDPLFAAPPGGLSLETLEAARKNAFGIRLQAVDGDIMPLGNATGMTQEERAMLGAWLDQQADDTP